MGAGLKELKKLADEAHRRAMSCRAERDRDRSAAADAAYADARRVFTTAQRRYNDAVMAKRKAAL